jgi:conjugal transfer pilin signal peptidase TrbI
MKQKLLNELRQWNTKHRTLSAVALIIIGYALFSFIWKHIEVVVSPSVDHRVFIKNVGVLEKGSYARFGITNDLLPDGAVTITKRFGCVAGERLETRGRAHFCNNEFLGIAKEVSITGVELPLFEYNGIIPAGMAFMSGSHHDSFDSRYWGFLDLSRQDIIPMRPLI